MDCAGERNRMCINKKIVGISFVLLFQIYNISTAVEAFLVTLQWPTSFVQPEFQMEVSLCLEHQRDVAGLNSIQTQGYFSKIFLSQNNNDVLYMIKPYFERFAVGTNMHCYSWSDKATALRIIQMSVDYKGLEHISDDVLKKNRAFYNVLQQASKKISFLNHQPYIFPWYGAYYAHLVEFKKDAYFTYKTFKAYTIELIEACKNPLNTQYKMSEHYTIIDPKKSAFQLPGFTKHESIASLFKNLFIKKSNDLASMPLLPCAYNQEDLFFTSGDVVYLPLFMTDPGQPYVPQGWNYAHKKESFSIKKSLMTNYSEQLSFETALYSYEA